MSDFNLAAQLGEIIARCDQLAANFPDYGGNVFYTPRGPMPPQRSLAVANGKRVILIHDVPDSSGRPTEIVIEDDRQEAVFQDTERAIREMEALASDLVPILEKQGLQLSKGGTPAGQVLDWLHAVPDGEKSWADSQPRGCGPDGVPGYPHRHSVARFVTAPQVTGMSAPFKINGRAVQAKVVTRAMHTGRSNALSVGSAFRALKNKLQALAECSPPAPATGNGHEANRNAEVEAEKLTDVKSPHSDVAHSDDFRSVRWFGTLYEFTKNQAPAVQKLFEHWEAGTPNVGGETLLSAVDHEAPPARVNTLFRGNPAWKKMIVSGPRKGSYRLKEPENT